MTVVYFVRHEHSFYSNDEYNRPLSDKGLVDRDNLTQLFRDKTIHAVYASPYKSAIQTVEEIAKEHNLEIHVDDRLKERILARGKISDFDDAILQLYSYPAYAFAGGESNNMAQGRAIECLKQIIFTHPNEHIVIGTHGNIMVRMMQYFDAHYDYDFWKERSMPDIYQLTFQQLSLIHVIRIWKGGSLKWT